MKQLFSLVLESLNGWNFIIHYLSMPIWVGMFNWLMKFNFQSTLPIISWQLSFCRKCIRRKRIVVLYCLYFSLAQLAHMFKWTRPCSFTWSSGLWSSGFSFTWYFIFNLKVVVHIERYWVRSFSSVMGTQKSNMFDTAYNYLVPEDVSNHPNAILTNFLFLQSDFS